MPKERYNESDSRRMPTSFLIWILTIILAGLLSRFFYG